MREDAYQCIARARAYANRPGRARQGSLFYVAASPAPVPGSGVRERDGDRRGQIRGPSAPL